MFGSPCRITAAASASPLPNNLSCTTNAATGAVRYAFASRNAAVVTEEIPGVHAGEPPTFKHRVAYGTIEDPNYSKSLSVFQATWLVYKDQVLLCILTNEAIILVNETADELLRHKISNAGSSTEATYVRGACIVGDLLCVGSSTGELIIFQFGASFNGILTAEHKANIRGAHETAVAAVVTDNLSENTVFDVVTTDMDGQIVVWDMSRLLPVLNTGGDLPMYIMTSMKSPCLCAVLSRNVGAVAAMNGLIMCYDIESKEKIVEIAGHARPINALAVDRSGTKLVSAGDDCRIMVWKFPSRQDATSDLLFSVSVPDRLVNGVCIIGESGAIAATTYDSNQILMFPLVESDESESRTRL